jgi:hypothetical protein
MVTSGLLEHWYEAGAEMPGLLLLMVVGALLRQPGEADPE